MSLLPISHHIVLKTIKHIVLHDHRDMQQGPIILPSLFSTFPVELSGRHLFPYCHKSPSLERHFALSMSVLKSFLSPLPLKKKSNTILLYFFILDASFFKQRVFDIHLYISMHAAMWLYNELK